MDAMAKTKTYENMTITAGELAHRIINYLQVRKYEVAYSYDEKKEKILGNYYGSSHLSMQSTIIFECSLLIKSHLIFVSCSH